MISSRWAYSERLFSLGNAFAGGLFLGVGFIHLLPEGIEQLAGYSTFPSGAFAATLGFAVMLLLDRILFADDSIESIHEHSDDQTLHAYVLITMLSVHSVVAGIALGLETSVAGFIAIMIGIVFHKGPEAFALMVCALSSGISTRSQWWFLGLFSVMAPAGLVIGVTSGFIFLEAGETYRILQGFFNVFAAGTFIYIAIIDIINKELQTHHIDLSKELDQTESREKSQKFLTRHDDRVLKFILILVGVLSIALVTDWAHQNKRELRESLGQSVLESDRLLICSSKKYVVNFDDISDAKPVCGYSPT